MSPPINDFNNGVTPATGAIAFTLTLKGASSIAIAFVAVIIHPLLALYQFNFGLGDQPAVDATFKITATEWILDEGLYINTGSATDLASLTDRNYKKMIDRQVGTNGVRFNDLSRKYLYEMKFNSRGMRVFLGTTGDPPDKPGDDTDYKIYNFII